MVSLPSSSNPDSVDSQDAREREIEYYRESYGSDSATKWTEEKRDVLWDWAILAHLELSTLRHEHDEVKGLAEFLSDNDVNQQIELRKHIAENRALKRRLKWHQAFSTMTFVVLLFADALRLWFKN